MPTNTTKIKKSAQKKDKTKTALAKQLDQPECIKWIYRSFKKFLLNKQSARIEEMCKNNK